ncbi:DUF3606 domain-containing protein [Variovorax sp. J22P240]|uniref:DUF3606 domain-containing protein n=1 Tax=Variovorax sp. J22P240 TaxID=3053514 RepID=UPI0025758E57|nr:DUF3606 domain-containing protein [Variovorax sp. J22P240]MDM0003039.1 DUF3606 domain-containing protein [Variovorax sp. J22P240]
MPNDPSAPNSSDPERIDLRSEGSIAEWTRKLDVTEAQLTEAIASVGDRPTDVELHLKGSRSTTNEEQVEKASGTIR